MLAVTAVWGWTFVLVKDAVSQYPTLPFLQVRYAVERTASTFFPLRPVRDRFRRAPWAFAFALLLMIVASIPLYLLKIEMVPREATGPTPGRIQGQQVIFEPLPSLGARADAVFRVKVLAQHQGDVRFKVQLTGEQLDRPLYEEESTRVFSD